MKTILFIEFNRFTGGSIFSIIALANDLKNRGYRVILAVPQKSEWGEILKESGLEYYSFVTWPWVKRIEDKITIKKLVKKSMKDTMNLYAEMQLYKLIKKEKVDLLHINTVNYGVGIAAAKKADAPIVWHIREFLEEDHGTGFIFPNNALKTLNKADVLIAISKCISNKYSSLLKNDNVITVYNGIDEAKYYTPDKKIFEENRIKIAIVGRIVEGKGQYELVKALKILIDNGNDNLELQIVGDGDGTYIQKIESFVKNHGLENHIKFAGFKSDVKSVLEDIDIVCVCSRNEAFGRTTVESMMGGCLVIGSDTAGTTEIIGDMETGILYKQGDYEDLALKLQYAVTNIEESKKIAQNGQKDAVKKFSIKNNTEAINRIYTKLLRCKNVK